MPSKLHISYIISFSPILNVLHCTQYSVSISEELPFEGTPPKLKKRHSKSTTKLL